jgi:PAS domain S-box-containing protein
MIEKERGLSRAELEMQLASAKAKNAQLLRLNADLQRTAREPGHAESAFEALARSGVIAVMVVARGGTILEANDAFFRLVGFSRDELIGRGKKLLEITAPEWREATERAMDELHEQGSKEPWEKEYVRKDGTRVRVLLVNVAISDRASIAFVVDLSERTRAEEALRRTEDQLRQAQKMEAIGRLAGGVAHDFNNMLSVIMSYGTLLRDEAAEGSSLRADLDEITAAATRAAALTKQLLLFSRQQVIEPRAVKLNDVVEGVQKMLKRTLGEDIELDATLAAEIGHIMADPNQIEQVLMNLVVNARDAMPTGGHLTIATKNVDPEDRFDPDLDSLVGPLVLLSVKDSGTGMDEHTRARLFEPFFTTKERGKGTGLGLSTVFGIVQQAGGRIVVDTEPGMGTTFRVYFPRVEPFEPVARAPQAHRALRGNETILLVEDEDQVRKVAYNILSRQGYRVIEAKDAFDALRLLEEQPRSVDLLLTDVVMPHMSGTELAERVAGARPAMRVLCMSGYTDDTISRHRVFESGVAFIQKPITPETLSKKVREVLERTCPVTQLSELKGAPLGPLG